MKTVQINDRWDARVKFAGQQQTIGGDQAALFYESGADQRHIIEEMPAYGFTTSKLSTLAQVDVQEIGSVVCWH